MAASAAEQKEWEKELEDGYSKYFDISNGSTLPQPGILEPQLSSMGFIFLKLKKGVDINIVCNLLASVENIQGPPYIADNSKRFPWDNDDTQKLNSNYESMLVFAQRTSNLLPSNLLHITFGFGYNIWCNIWKMPKPEGFMPFETLKNEYDTKSRLPFSSNKMNQYYKDFFEIPKDEGKSEYDVIMQLKAASDTLINRVFAHAFQLFNGLCENVELKLGFCKQRNQFGFFDAASEASHTANPTINVGCVNRAYNDAKNGIEKRKKYGDQYIDMGRYNTVLIGNEVGSDDKNKFKNGTFGVFCEFVHDLNYWHSLTIKEQDDTFGREKESGSFVKPPKQESGFDPLNGSLNGYLPQSHIVRTHIRGISKLQCPMHTLKTLSKSDASHTFLFPDPDQNTENTNNNLEPSTVPMQIYRQAASFAIAKEDGNVKGLHFFAYSRDCHIMNDIFWRMIGFTSTVSDTKEADKLDPILSKGKDHNYYQVDSLLQTTKAIGASYYYFPNFNQLLLLAKWPKTTFGNNNNMVMKNYLDEHGMNSLNWDLGLNTEMVPNWNGNGTHVNWGVNFVSNIISFYGMLRLGKFYKGGKIPKRLQTNNNDGASEDSNTVTSNMQSDPLKYFMLGIAQTSIEVEWNKMNVLNRVKAIPITKKNRVVIVGGGCSGLVCGYELKKVGFDVIILEKADFVGGRVQTFRFTNGLHAEAGAMRLPGDADPAKRGVSHWLTDFYIELFNLEVSPFHNDDPNTLIKILNYPVFKKSVWSNTKNGIAKKIENEVWTDWDCNIKANIKIIEEMKDPNNKDHPKYLLFKKMYDSQLEILQGIETIEQYFGATTNVIVNNLVEKLNKIKTENGSYACYEEAIEIWDIWVARWSKFSLVEFLRTKYSSDRDVRGNALLMTPNEYEIAFMGLRAWPEIAIRGLLIVQYMPSAQDVSLVELLRDSFGYWWADPMHTLRDGMDVLPRAFTNPNLWGPSATANKDWILSDNVFYGQNVTKINYNNSNGNCTVYSRNDQTGMDREFECDYIILTTPLPVIQNIEFKPPLSNFKQEAIRMTRYEASTKVLLQFKHRFWEYNVLPKDLHPNPHNPALDNGDLSMQSNTELSKELELEDEKQKDNENSVTAAIKIKLKQNINNLKDETVTTTTSLKKYKLKSDNNNNNNNASGAVGTQNSDYELDLLPRYEIILGGLSYSTSTSSQIVYPTPVKYQFKQNDYQNYIDWSVCDKTHIDDGLKRGVLVSYTWGYEAQRMASLSENEAIRIVLQQVAKLHAEAKGKHYKCKEIEEIYYNKILSLFESGKRMAWSTNKDMGGGAFVLFAPFNYEDYWKDLIRVPEGTIKLNDIYSRSDENEKEDAKSIINKTKTILNQFEKLLQIRAKNGLLDDGVRAKISKLYSEFSNGIENESNKNENSKNCNGNLRGLKEKLALIDKLQDLKIYFGGEGVSWTNGWIQGAMEASMRVVYQLFDNYQMQYNKDYFGNPEMKKVLKAMDAGDRN